MLGIVYVLAGLVLSFAAAAPPLLAQLQTLPKGVGTLQLSHRLMSAIDEEYDASGNKQSLAKPFEKDLSGKTLLNGEGGEQLRTLANALREYDTQEEGGLVDQLQLGRLHGDVNVDIDAQIFGAAYGVTDKLMLYLAVPYIHARSEARLYLDGPNTAGNIKDQLAGLAFQELQDGLSRAEAISTRDVQDQIAAAGYRPIEKWSDKGIGDLHLGAKTAHNVRLGGPLRYGIGLDGRLTAPTGRTDDPDVLTDVPFGTGYYSLGTTLAQRIGIKRQVYAETELTYQHNFATTARRRVPENGEALVAAERTSTVDLNPCDDTEAVLGIGSSYGGWGASARIGRAVHFADEYSGALTGDYASLGAGSDTEEIYREFAVSFDTVNAYKKKELAVPMMLGAVMHQPLQSRNRPENTYYELRLTSFFATPALRK